MISKWSISKVDGHWCMTRCVHDNTVESRELTWWERIKFFWLKDDITCKKANDSLDEVRTEFTCICKKWKGWVTAGKWTKECPICHRVYFGRYNSKTLQIDAVSCSLWYDSAVPMYKRLKSIYTKDDYDKAIRVLDEVAGRTDLTKDQEDFVEWLSTLVETYENEHERWEE